MSEIGGMDATTIPRKVSRGARRFYNVAAIFPLASVFAGILLPQIYLSSYDAYLAAEATQSRPYQLVSIGVFVSIVAALYLMTARVRSLGITSEPLVFAFCGWAALSTFWSISAVSSFVSAAALLVLCVAAAMFWALPETVRTRAYAGGAVSIPLLIATMALVLPIRERSLGWITPNLLGHFGLALIFLATQIRWSKFYILFGLSIIIFAQARTVMISAIIFLILYFAVFPRLRTNQARASFLLLLSIAAAVAVIFADGIVQVVSGLITSAFQIDDPLRGADSGLSGRVGRWQTGLDVLAGHELLGFGFKTRTAISQNTFNAHSGILNGFLDIGYLGVLLLCATYIRAIFVSAKSHPLGAESSLIGAFLISMVPILVVEPNYINFAHPTSFLFILCICGTMQKMLPRRVHRVGWGNTR